MALAAGLAVGVVADQVFPEYVPALGLPAARGRVDTSEMQQALRVLQAHYYDRLDYSKLSHGTVRGMIESLNDPPSQYLDPAQYRSQQQSYAGRFTGIGVRITFGSGYPVIASVFANSPAEAAGIQAGDQIISIEGHDARGMSAGTASGLIEGREGTPVRLTVRRAGSDRDLAPRRAVIVLPSVKSAKLGAVLYLKITMFGAQTAGDFDAQLRKGLPGSSGIILDLRDDGGGYIDAAESVIGDLVGGGEAFELRDKRGTVERKVVSGDHPAAAGPPLLVLVNANTASSSEIVSGSLRQHGRARLVGVKTYGKASVQQDFPLPDGADLHLTIRHWFLADGTSVESGGWTPDVEISMPQGAAEFDADNPGAGHAGDAQLNRALELLGAA